MMHMSRLKKILRQATRHVGANVSLGASHWSISHGPSSVTLAPWVVVPRKGSKNKIMSSMGLNVIFLQKG